MFMICKTIVMNVDIAEILRKGSQYPDARRAGVVQGPDQGTAVAVSGRSRSG